MNSLKSLNHIIGSCVEQKCRRSFMFSWSWKKMQNMYNVLTHYLHITLQRVVILRKVIVMRGINISKVGKENYCKGKKK